MNQIAGGNYNRGEIDQQLRTSNHSVHKNRVLLYGCNVEAVDGFVGVGIGGSLEIRKSMSPCSG